MVEGNTSFYQTPSEETVMQWRDSLNEHDCKICFKLPQTVTHSDSPDWPALTTFLQRISPLEQSLGPLLLVFPAKISPAKIHVIRAILERLPPSMNIVIEVRHPDFFGDDNALTPLLHEFAAHRVVLDSRPLYRGNQNHPDVLKAKHEKPNVPVLPKVYNGRAFVRLVLHPESHDNKLFIEQWAKMVARYLNNDIDTYFSIHCPNNFYCPTYAVAFHKALQSHMGNAISDLPPFPVPQQPTLL
jgi:uncharacterized protein YecE (DUF72 family)